MGHGAARELESASGPLPDLDPALAERLDVAMAKMDTLDAEFKSSRDDERLAQMSKRWNAVCKQVDADFRTIAKVLVNSHQLSLDMGSDGGGIAIKPWMEDTQGKFERLSLRLTADDDVVASIGGRDFARGKPEDVDFDWLMKLVVEWLVQSVEGKR
jgi:hypothetical protein